MKLKKRLFEYTCEHNLLSEHNRIHTEIVYQYAKIIGETIGLDKHNMQILKCSTILHDIGKATHNKRINKIKQCKKGRSHAKYGAAYIRKSPKLRELINNISMKANIEIIACIVENHSNRKGAVNNFIQPVGKLIYILRAADTISKIFSENMGQKEIHKRLGRIQDREVNEISKLIAKTIIITGKCNIY